MAKEVIITATKAIQPYSTHQYLLGASGHAINLKHKPSSSELGFEFRVHN